MSKIAFIQSKKHLKRYLSGILPDSAGKLGYIACERPDSNAIDLLKRSGFREIPMSEDLKSRAYKDRFIAEYVNLIGAVGKSCDSKKWWATTITSKERFTSNLPNLLEQFSFITYHIGKKNFEYLIILNPSWVIVPALKDFVRHSNIVSVCFLNPFKKWTEAGYFYCRRVVGIICHGIRIYFRAYYARRSLKPKLNDILGTDKQYCILKNFIYDHSFKEDGNYEDVFFGCLPEFLKDKKNILIYSCILGNYINCVSKIKNNVQYNIIPLEYFVSVVDILAAAKELIWGSVQMNDDVYFLGQNVKTIINNELTRTFNSIQLYQFLHYWSTKKLLEKVKVDTFILTYENKSWERMCLKAIREKSHQIKVIGYQHTVVPEASVNMFASRQEKERGLLPDSILTVGQEPKKIMEKYGNYGEDNITVSCGLRFGYLFQAPVLERKRSGNILLALEGVFEVYKVVNYVMSQLKAHPYYKVSIRTHPVLPLSRIRYKLQYDINNLNNFKLSNGASLSQDIQWADTVIYWGSTVALEALAMGRPVIHFDAGSFLSYDPLFECSYLKWKVFEKDSLLEVIEQISSLSNDEFVFQRAKAQEYIRNYFYPITERGLSKFIGG